MKIDYEITVDVSNKSEEVKKKVQDAFFKLGFKWRCPTIDGKYYDPCVDRYTNTFDGG